MKKVKRIEIIIPAVELKKVLRLLKESGVSGYTVIRSVTGFGDRGNRRATSSPEYSTTPAFLPSRSRKRLEGSWRRSVPFSNVMAASAWSRMQTG